MGDSEVGEADQSVIIQHKQMGHWINLMAHFKMNMKIIINIIIAISLQFLIGQNVYGYWDTCDLSGWNDACAAAGGVKKQNGVDSCYVYYYCAYCDQSLKPPTIRIKRSPDTNGACCDTWEADGTICNYDDTICELPPQCGVSASASTGGEVCNGAGDCGSSVDSGDQCNDQFVAQGDEGWSFAYWDVPESNDSCSYSCEGDLCSLSSNATTCPGVTAFFTKNENDELCDFYPAHDDYAVQVKGYTKDGACYEGISVVTSLGDSFNFGFTETYDGNNETVFLDSPWMTAEDWKEYCVNQVMPSQYCFDVVDPEDFEEIDDITPPPDIEPINPDQIEENPTDQDPEDEGEWATRDAVKTHEENEQKRYDGLTGYLKKLAENIAGAINNSKDQMHTDIQTLDRNQKSRNDQLISAVKAAKASFEDIDDTDEDLIGQFIDSLDLHMEERHGLLMVKMDDLYELFDDNDEEIDEDARERINEILTELQKFNPEIVTPEQLPVVTEEDIVFDNDPQQEFETAFDDLMNNPEIQSIEDNYKLVMTGGVSSFQIQYLGHNVTVDFSSYQSILQFMGNVLYGVTMIGCLIMIVTKS